MAKVERQSLTDQIVAEIRRQIVGGILPEGMPLRQERLAAELGVSRIPLREAIGRLEAEGLVTTELHKGAVVSVLSLEEIRELFEIRIQLETWLFGLAIPSIQEVDLQLAEEITQQMVGETAVEDWGERNFRFHEALYRSSGRSMAMKLLRSVHDNANRYVNLQIAVAADTERELVDHRQLIAFARLRDVDGGVAKLREHIERVMQSLLESIGESRRAKAAQEVA